MPRVAVITYEDIKPHWEEQPEGWRYSGQPDLMLIDADNEDHWNKYVWSHIADQPDRCDELILPDVRIPERNCGYEIGYYPRSTEDDWEMIPEGPFCAACVDPRDDMEGAIIPSNRIDLPQAWHTELIDSPDEIESNVYTDRTCAGCGAVLYAASNWTD